MSSRQRNESTPLLRDESEEATDEREILELSKEDGSNPRTWTRREKLSNVAVISLMAILSPLASSMFTPGIAQIASDFDTTQTAVIGATTGFVVMLGVGPLFWAPLSETFGRRKLYLACFGTFALLQIPTALAPNLPTLIAIRTVSGFFGSVGIANGGGTISDMFDREVRASVFGWYLLGPLLGPTIGPLLGGVIVQRLGWRWIFLVLAIICSTNTLAGYFLLKETYAPMLLEWKKRDCERKYGKNRYTYEGEDTRPLWRKLASSFYRPVRIFVQPIVLTMSVYQALVFSTTYSLYTNMQAIYGGEYGFSTEQVGLLYLGPGIGFLLAVRVLVPRIDQVYNKLVASYGGKESPEFRLPLANIGAVFIPISLFWFAWTVQYHLHWGISIASTFFYGIGQVMILNCVSNYFIDSFEKYAASAIAAGAVFRAIVGGTVPLFVPMLFDRLGYGWGMSVFAFLGLSLAPAPVFFWYYGGWIRERFAVEL